MFTSLLFFSCTQTPQNESSASLNDLTREVAELKELILEQSAQIQSLEEESSLMLTEYNTLLNGYNELNEQYHTLNENVSTLNQENSTPVMIKEDTTWNINPNGDGDYASLNEALSALREMVLIPGVELVIQLSSGTYIFDQSIDLTHSNGRQITIQGNEEDPLATVLQFSQSNGFTSNGLGVSLIKNMHIMGSDVESGVMLYNNAVLNAENLSVSHFKIGLQIDTQAKMLLSGNNGIELCETGIYVHTNGQLISYDFLSSTNNTSHGMSININGTVYANTMDMNNNQVHGFVVANNSTANVTTLNAQGNGAFGVFTDVGGSLTINNAQIHNNNYQGLYISRGSAIKAEYASITGNGMTGAAITTGSFANFNGAEISDNVGGVGVSYGSTVTVFDAVLQNNQGPNGLGVDLNVDESSFSVGQ